MGIGLGAMAAKLTYGVRKFESVDREMRTAIAPLHDLSSQLIPMIDADTNAFNEYMQGLAMPRGTEEEKTLRTEKMQQGLKTAIEVPLKTMKLGDSAWEAMQQAAAHGNPACKSDIEVGARALETGIWGAYKNVCINMEGIKDQAYKTRILSEAEAIASRAKKQCEEILKIVDTSGEK